MANEKFLTDAMVEEEIARLKESEYVKLAKKEEQIRYRHRQYMYGLRNKEKRGKALAAQGFTLDNIEELMFGSREEEDYEA